jgi:AcrR family transcriptional regulator
MARTSTPSNDKPSRSHPPRGSRQRALDAALALFEARGVANTTIEEVRDRSGVSIGSLYHHFGSRDGLVAALFDELLLRYRRHLMAALSDSEDARALLDGFVRAHIGWAVGNPAAARFLSEHRRNPAVTSGEAQLQQGTADFLRPILTRLKPAVSAGTIRSLPPELLLSLVIGPVQTWTRLWLDGQTGLKPETAAKRIGELVWAAVAVPSTYPRRKT